MAATMSGTDAIKSPSTTAASGPKQQLKSTSSGKALDGARKQAASPVEGQSRKQQPTQPKAWQGTNPITQRASAIPNGTDKPLPKTPSQPQTKSTAESHGDKQAHDRALYLLANLTGYDATLTLKNGEQFSGVFSGGTFESTSKPQYVLKMVKRTRLPSRQQMNGATELPNEYIGEGEDHVMVFDKEDTVDLAVNDVVTLAAQPTQNGSINSSFRTDTEISGRDPSMPRARELQRWEPSADTGMDLSLEDSGETGWDQFAANERMYGVQSTYDENIYTTAIDRSDPSYKQKEAEAARIAREIEGSTPADAHVAEERRRDADRADGLDEEEKYSGVQRQPVALPKRAAGSYVPPSQRPITSGPTVPGAPFDPAIISSQLAKPTAAVSSEKATDAVKATEANAAPASSEEQKIESTGASVKESKPVAGPSTLPKKTENTAEDHIRNVTDSFKQFANNEKLRMRQAQEAKRSNARAEKNVKLNDLKKFAANFKLTSRVPDDLVPILAKDREKQIEIQSKADEAAKEQEQKAKDKGVDKLSGEASPAPSSTASQTGIGAGVDQRLPANQHSRARMSQSIRAPALPAQMQSPRQALGPGPQQNRAYVRQPIQPLPDFRIPTGPAVQPSDKSPLSPGSASRHLNANAPTFEFRPSAGVFTPSGNTPSPQRTASSRDASNTATETANFFDKDKNALDGEKRKELDQKFFDSAFNPIKRMAGAEYTEEQKKLFASNGGFPQPYRTPPRWEASEANVMVSYKDSFIKSQAHSQSHSPMHTPNVNGGAMPHAHQLPLHIQGGPQVSTPAQRQAYLPPPPPHQAHPQGFDPRMQQFGPTGSVQSSPRFPQAQMAFNGQMPGGMPMPPFAGGPGQMPGYGMSPSMQFRSPNMGPPGAPAPMMMMPNQVHGQMGQMPPGYPRGSAQFPPQMMGGAPGGMPMVAQASAGGFMNGPGMPQQQSYSPMPPHAQPHNIHMQQHGNHHGGYTGSPRPHMMQHSGSHQGFLPTGGPGGPMMPQGPQQQPSPYGGHHHHQHPYHLQHRQMSAGGMGYGGPPQMTPRQQHALPHSSGQQQVSPGMLGPASGPGDEGKPAGMP